MISGYFSEAWAGIAPAVGNHLWQSTLLLLAVWAVTLPLRQHQARTRHWLWLLASLKFLVPFCVLVDVGAFLGATRTPAATRSGLSLAIDYVSQPFTPAARVAPVSVTMPAAQTHPGLLPLLISLAGVVWLCGFVTILALWCVRWRRVAALVRHGAPLTDRRVAGMLQRLEKAEGIQRPIQPVLSAGTLEPGIFGIFRSVLLWPQGISEHLDDDHIQAILAHEVCHVRRRDNLAAALHMLVEAIFWFHPLVWWMGKRLVEERELACDEQALELGNEPGVYAESILKTCEFCVGSPLACVSGVTGAELKHRITRIMANRGARRLDLRGKLLLGAAGLLALVVPLGFGLTHAPQSAAAEPEGVSSNLPDAKFEVASIRLAAPQDIHRVMFRMMDPETDSRFYATNVTLKMLVRAAYDVQDGQIEGGPSWLDSDHYDIQARGDSAVDAELKKLPPDEAKLVKEHMLQELLADRFHLKIEKQTRQMQVYALVVAKNGPKLQPSKFTPPAPDAKQEPNGGSDPTAAGPRPGQAMMRIQRGGEMSFQMDAGSMPGLAGILSMQLGRIVLDQTGLKGIYDLTLTWTPGEGEGPMTEGGGPGPMPGATGPAPAPDSSGPSIFTALEDQLGLKLKSEKGPVDALDIVGATQPTAN